MDYCNAFYILNIRNMGFLQCCGSKSGTRCLSEIGSRISDPGSRIPNPYFWELNDNFWVKSSKVLFKLAQIFFRLFTKLNNFQFCDICGYKTSHIRNTGFLQGLLYITHKKHGFYVFYILDVFFAQDTQADHCHLHGCSGFEYVQ